MSKIPYKFIPLPHEFLTDDFIDDPDMMRLVRWIFKRISTEKTTVPIKRNKINLDLEPFEFIFGRSKCAKEIEVSEKKIRSRINQLVGLGFIKERASKSKSTFTVYRIRTEALQQLSKGQQGQQLSKGQQLGQEYQPKGQHVGQQVQGGSEGSADEKGQHFSIKDCNDVLSPETVDFLNKIGGGDSVEKGQHSEKKGQHFSQKSQKVGQHFLEKKGQHVLSPETDSLSKEKGQHFSDKKGQHLGQHLGHNLDIRSKIKENHHLDSSSFSESEKGDDRLTDDFFFKKEEEKMNPRIEDRKHDKTEVCKGIFLTESQLANCIQLKGSIEAVKQAIDFIQDSPKRKHPISDWPNALAKWQIDLKPKVDITDNLAYADKLCSRFGSFQKGWRCSKYHDSKKDQQGVLFEAESAYVDSIFIAFIDPNFKNNAFNQLIEAKLATKPKEKI